MSYVDRILQPDEQVLHIGRLHWIMHAPGVLVVLGGLVLAAFNGGFSGWLGTVELLFVAAGLVLFAHSKFVQWTTEIAVTTRRVILKTGFISRETHEMNLHQVESVGVRQSMLGRLLGYGTVQVNGTGVGLEAIRSVADPIRFRTAITAR